MDNQQYIVNAEITLIEAIKRMSQNEHKGLIVVENDIVIDVFTRYDLVRNLHYFGIKSVLLKDNLKYSFDYYLKKIDENDILKSRHSIIPVIDEGKRLLSIAFPCNKLPKDKYEIPVVIMAGGLGTRLYPYTKILPKPLVPVNGTPMIEIIINKFRIFGSKNFYLIVNHKKEMIQAYFNDLFKDYNVFYGVEKKQLGTAGGLCYIKNYLRDTFFLTNCDTLLLEDYNEIFEYHKRSKSIITMIVSVKSFDIPYGIVNVNHAKELVNISEKPSYGLLVNTGMYVVEKEVLDYINDEETISFPNVIKRVKADGKKVSVYPITEDKWVDLGQVPEYEEALEKIKKGGNIL